MKEKNLRMMLIGVKVTTEGMEFTFIDDLTDGEKTNLMVRLPRAEIPDFQLGVKYNLSFELQRLE